jgi:hypothetical protein
MAKFRVGMTRAVYEGTTIEVEAANRDAAEALALKQADDGNVDWHPIDYIEGHAEVSDIEEVTNDQDN